MSIHKFVSIGFAFFHWCALALAQEPPSVVKTGFETEGSGPLALRLGWQGNQKFIVEGPSEQSTPESVEGSHILTIVSDAIGSFEVATIGKAQAPLGPNAWVLASTYIRPPKLIHPNPSKAGILIRGLNGSGSESASVAKLEIDPSGEISLIGSNTLTFELPNASGYRRLELYANFSTQKAVATLDGQLLPGSVPFLSPRTVFQSTDLYVTSGGGGKWNFDLFKVYSELGWSSNVYISGRVLRPGWNRPAWMESSRTEPIDLRIAEPGVPLNAGGASGFLDPFGYYVAYFNLFANPRGKLLDAYALVKSCLVEKPFSVVYPEQGNISDVLFVPTFTVKPGDANNDNTVSTDDYLILNATFDKTWGETFDLRADFSGDLYIGTDDYLLLNAYFDMVGAQIP